MWKYINLHLYINIHFILRKWSAVAQAVVRLTAVQKVPSSNPGHMVGIFPGLMPAPRPTQP